MAVTPNPPGQNPQLTSQEQELRAQVGLLDEQALSWKNILNLRLQAKKAAKEEESIKKQLLKLQGEEAKNVGSYITSVTAVKRLEKDLEEFRIQGNKRAARAAESQIKQEKELQKQLEKTKGGALAMYKIRAKGSKDALSAERQLIKDINKERGVGAKLADLFRSKEQRQKQIDIARAKAGGGVNIPPGGGAGAGAGAAGADGGGGKGKLIAAAAGVGIIGLIIAAISSGIEKLKAPFKAIGGLVKSNLGAPLAQASNLVSGGIGGGFGIGGGAVSGAGATSLLGGFQQLVSTIPLVGPILGGVVGLL
jgi:hypothetical protein